MHSFLGVPILIGGVPFGSLYFTEKADGGQFTMRTRSRSRCSRGSPVSRSITRGRYTGAAARGEELARSVAALEATTEITRAVGGETDLDAILELVAKRGRALVSAQTC